LAIARAGDVIDTRRQKDHVRVQCSEGPTAVASPIRVHDMDLVVCSEAMRRLMSMVERVARGNAAVLITGETGTGKELIARSVHHHSFRSDRPWIDVNCGALPEYLVESELFGYERGAFSGADSPKPGLFELADKGTFFLDEIGELEPKSQVKLLRVLDGAPYYRLGGHRKIAVDVRIIAATNQPLEEAVKVGRFRRDLFHRLGQIQLRVPPLRERSEDVVALAEYFLAQSHPDKKLSDATLQILRLYSWPGNIRELRNVVLQAAMTSHDDEIQPSCLPAEITAIRSAPLRKASVDQAPPGLDEVEKQAIVRALAHADGHHGLAAEQLGISRRTLSRKLKQYKMDARESERKALGTLSGHEKQYFRAMTAMPISITTDDVQFIASAVNVSTGGLALEGIPDPFQLAKSFHVRFTLPNTEETFELEAEVVWADAQGKAGIRFLNVSDEWQKFLRSWLKQQQIEEGWAVSET
jgi:transcriptional regulator with PAS, ATPase and Fis domain